MCNITAQWCAKCVLILYKLPQYGCYEEKQYVCLNDRHKNKKMSFRSTSVSVHESGNTNINIQEHKYVFMFRE